MSHNATYSTSISCVEKDTLDIALKWLQSKGVLKIVENIVIYGYYGSRQTMKARGIGVQIEGEHYGIDITISPEGTVQLTGESMAEGSFRHFQRLLESAYKAVVARMMMAQMGYDTEMEIVYENGMRIVDLVGAD